ncbi:hypothetical protein JX266_013401 [Neoarthrinium moseri]|nr:hypothetical protein JX266_013401 [Neoarthrinium moseri]
MGLLAAVLLYTASVLAVPGSVLQRASPLTISTSSGSVTGFINKTTPDVRQFLGIPFAEPPLGSLRFQPPVAKSAGAPITANKLPANCIQFSGFSSGLTIAGPVSQDCLYLNVYTPANAASGSLPVLIWIYGGAFIIGGSDVPYQVPDQWVERTKSHIVVTFNYRLGAFGFPNARAQTLNAGLLDQRLAVEWVAKNIAAFGGNPSKLVIWGQSAGAASVGLYGYAYPQNSLLYGAIADSGGPSMLLANDPTHSTFTGLAGTVGCGNLDANGEMACMQAVNSSKLESAVLSYPGSFAPALDGKTAFNDTTARISSGRIAKYPMIMGSNANEGGSFGGSDPITCPTVDEIENRQRYGLTTYQYFYAGNFTNVSQGQGATHSSELPLVFGTYGLYGTSTTFEKQVSEGMQDYWLAFIKNPNAPPSAAGTVWPPSNANTKSVMEFGANNRVQQLISGSSIGPGC